MVPLAPDKRIIGHRIGPPGKVPHVQFSVAAGAEGRRDHGRDLFRAACTQASRRDGHTSVTGRDKQDAAGHGTPGQTDVYNHELDVCDPAGTHTKAG